jgi:hypothetical protein
VTGEEDPEVKRARLAKEAENGVSEALEALKKHDQRHGSRRRRRGNEEAREELLEKIKTDPDMLVEEDDEDKPTFSLSHITLCTYFHLFHPETHSKHDNPQTSVSPLVCFYGLHVSIVSLQRAPRGR